MNPPNTPHHHMGPREVTEASAAEAAAASASLDLAEAAAASFTTSHSHSVPFAETMQDKITTQSGSTGDMRTIPTYSAESQSVKTTVDVAGTAADVIMKDAHPSAGTSTTTSRTTSISSAKAKRMSSYSNNPPTGGSNGNGNGNTPQAARILPVQSNTNGPIGSGPGPSQDEFLSLASSLGSNRRISFFEQQHPQQQLDTNPDAGTGALPSSSSSSLSPSDIPVQPPKKPLTAAETALLAVHQYRTASATNPTATGGGNGNSITESSNMNVPPKPQAMMKNGPTPMELDNISGEPKDAVSSTHIPMSMSTTSPNSNTVTSILPNNGRGKETMDTATELHANLLLSTSKETSSDVHSPGPVQATVGLSQRIRESLLLSQQQQQTIGEQTPPSQTGHEIREKMLMSQQQKQTIGEQIQILPMEPFSGTRTAASMSFPESQAPRSPSPPQNDHSLPFGQLRELKVEDALNYLDQVKIEFGSSPRIYNEFLEIMKKFKGHELDTPGVIMRVSDLFRGYNKLILGFNTFLPEGFKISIRDLEEGGRFSSREMFQMFTRQGIDLGRNGNGQARGPGHPSGNSNQGVNRMGNGQQTPLGVHVVRQPGQLQSQQANNRAGFSGMSGAQAAENMVSSEMQQRIRQNPSQGMHSHAPAQASDADVRADMAHLAMHQQQQQQAAQNVGQGDEGQGGHQAVEFDHAITYVTTIKKRFATEPRTYQQFLEILHTYQKEQRGIREVLEQVSSLFADHPDLLREFTYFLPEAVQEQAKERLQAAAAEAEARQAAARQRSMETTDQYTNHQFHPNHAAGQTPNDRGGNQEIIDMTKKQQPIPDGRSPSSPGQRKRPHSPSNITLQYPIMPETMIYSAGVERQFFDMAKEALRSSSRDGELAWAEFLKCMHYYAQEILSRNDLLRYMEDLLGKQHADLFEEFKRILAAAGAPGAPSHDDTWHSVPLSEIDFSRCRRCTPSYRALPRDYPVATFSGRCEEEAKLLNDVWISLPDGSEESYTFRHMRKNQHEEVLFRCEDERFEIDMVIDSNATALKRLEPIAEEIAMLQQKETLHSTDGKDRHGLKSTQDKGGLAGKTIKFSFDKRILNTIHRHAISRIYGDAGQEMLELMHKNPVVAIPVVVKRLKQKDKDFRAAREVLNLRWKELAEINYYKSIDHRSLTWRTIDKRATSTRTLVAEIKDRAANSGTESQPAMLAKKEKAKEEFGSFYERTMGHYIAKKMDLTNLPRPSESLFTPHYSMKYDNISWAQRDAYRILSFALERGSISPGDKERCHRIWKDFLAPFFNLSCIWMQSPAVAYAACPHRNSPSIVSNGEESGNEEDESSTEENDIIGDMMVTEEVLKDCSNDDAEARNSFNLLDNQPIPSGAVVSTLYGEGIVIRYMHKERTCVVSLPFGATAYLNRDSVLCTILPVDQFDLHYSVSSAEDTLERDDDKIILGPQSLYLFFRLHQVLIRRLNIARKLAFSVDDDQSLCTLIEHIESDSSAPVGQKRYEAYLSLVYSLVEGGYNSPFQGGSTNTAEGGKYEDRVRCLLGHEAYELATMDKLVSHILKHLQNLANDDTMHGMIQIFKKQLESGSFKPLAFRQEAAMISEGENVFAFQYCKIPKSDSTIMHAQLLGCITDHDDEDDDSDKVSLTEMEVSETNDGPAPKKLRRD